MATQVTQAQKPTIRTDEKGCPVPDRGSIVIAFRRARDSEAKPPITDGTTPKIDVISEPIAKDQKKQR